MADIVVKSDCVGHLCLVRGPCPELSVSEYRSDVYVDTALSGNTSTLPLTPISLHLSIVYC